MIKLPTDNIVFKAVSYNVHHTPSWNFRMVYGEFLPTYNVHNTRYTKKFQEFFSKYGERDKSRSRKINMVNEK